MCHLFLLSLFFISCSPNPNKDFQIFYGSWYINEMHYKNENLTLKEGDVINRSFPLGFEKNNILWIDDLDSTKTIFADFKFYKVKNQIFLDIKNSKDKRINGNYNVYVDTLQTTPQNYVLKMTVDSEETFFIAHRNYAR